MNEEIYIKKYEVSTMMKKDLREARIEIIVTTMNETGKISDGESLRVWIKGKNTLDEPIEIVLTEHLYIKEVSENRLSAPLYNPVIWTEKNPYNYEGKLELIDSDGRVKEEHKFEVTVLND